MLAFLMPLVGGILKEKFLKESKSVRNDNEVKEKTRNKGGRPKKAIRRDEQLAVMCTLVERKVIEYKAKISDVSVSEYLRTLGVKGQVGRKIKTLPKEI